MANQHGDFIWYELITSDPDAAQAFYAPLLGWTFADGGVQDMDYRVFSKGENDVGGLMKLPEGAPMPPCWMGYIRVDDVDAAAASIQQVGGAIHMQPHDIPEVGRIAMLADPQGVMFYVMKGAGDGTSTAFAADKPMPGHCAWNELVTTDQSAASAFYTKQFGWEQKDDMDMGPMGKYEFLWHGGKMIGALMTKPPEMPVPAWMYYFRVPDIDAAIDTLTANGGELVNGPQEIPGGEFVINAVDPQGAMFALVGAKQ